MRQTEMTKRLLWTAVTLTLLVVALFSYYYLARGQFAKAQETVASPTPTATLSASSTPSPAPTATTTASPSPTPTATATTTPTQTTLPTIDLTVSQTSCTSSGGSECSVTVSSVAGASISVASSSGITTWQDPGIIYIYPTTDGAVTITASANGYQSASATVNVTYVAPTPTPNNTTTDGSLLTPNVSRYEDLTFWFRGCMSDTKDMFFDTAARYGVDPFLAIAIADHETGYGASDACNINNNFGGLIGSEGIKSFGSKQEGIDALMYLLQYYNQKGRITVSQIAEWYCPGQPEWITRVTTIYNSFHQ